MGIISSLRNATARKFVRKDIAHAMQLPSDVQSQIATLVIENVSDFLTGERDPATVSAKFQIIRHQRNNYGLNGLKSFTDPVWLAHSLSEDIAFAVLRADDEAFYACVAWLKEYAPDAMLKSSNTKASSPENTNSVPQAARFQGACKKCGGGALFHPRVVDTVEIQCARCAQPYTITRRGNEFRVELKESQA